MARGASLARRYAERRFAVLFGVLLVTIAGHGFVAALLPIVNPLDWLLGLSLLAVVLSARRGGLGWSVRGLAVAFVATRLAYPLLDHHAPLITSQLLLATACLLAASVAARRALGAGPVDAEHIFAALDAYILAGIAFGVGYWSLEALAPGSFSTGAHAMTPPRAVYFSFVTQATVGYGDIVPLSDAAQGVVVAQGVGGQMYLAVLVARLVSLYSRRADR